MLIIMESTKRNAMFLLSGAFSLWCVAILENPEIPRADNVGTRPAEIAFTLIPFGPSSNANCLTACSNAAFALPITL